jgi:hypothetical protein
MPPSRLKRRLHHVIRLAQAVAHAAVHLLSRSQSGRDGDENTLVRGGGAAHGA